MKAMSSPGSRSFLVTVTRLPVTPCQIRRRTVAYRPGSLREVLTEHGRRAHPAALGFPSRWPVPQTAPSAHVAGQFTGRGRPFLHGRPRWRQWRRSVTQLWCEPARNPADLHAGPRCRDARQRRAEGVILLAQGRLLAARIACW